jgi:aspartate beta-hydroxylase
MGNMSPEKMMQEIERLEAQAMRAHAAGRRDDTFKAWEEILAMAPNHVPTLTNIGRYTLSTGEVVSAKRAFQRVVDVDGKDPQQWVNLALACKGLRDEAGEERAITSALTVDPMDLLALLMRADLLQRQGKHHKAASAFGAAASVAPPLHLLHPDLRPSVEFAMSYKNKYDAEFGAFLDAHLDESYKQYQGEDLRRFSDSLDIMVGRKRRFDSQSMVHHYPGLAPIEFFDRAEFPWLDAFEAATDSIRNEFLRAMAAEQGFAPYITYPTDAPLNQWAELNHSLKWSAFHLIKQGKQVAENAVKCPTTMALLATAPQPAQSGRTPSAMFSLLKPQTHIPPHTGVSNVRLVTHLPLIIPEGCQFRVGNTLREWVPGQAWVFDDTIEHEAINRSDQNRVVLIFDIWHPHLSAAERGMITAMSEGVSRFVGDIEDVGL